ncbi:cell wall metabolism sensor histidine kinase WalK [Homoserinimonas sp. OAct 916]|uniref:sensor histidine kinase n=1 Tax=Homoserinimonas sp. OAct 916 TaxID=2211450 RepID=UPI001E616691|nr:HAMP domain-containing sensor histidine kinase [Homoserinimonas sp. OAct 916]
MNPHDGTELRRASLRLAAQFAALIVVLFAILGGVVFAIVQASQGESIERTLRDASVIDSPMDAPSGVFVAIVGEDGVQLPPDLPAGLPDESALHDVVTTGRTVQQNTTIDGQTYVIRTARDNGRVTQVAVNLHESQEELRRLGTALVVSGVIAAVAASLIALWMARRAMRPLVDALTLQRRFVMDASHELRTPLTLLSTRAQLVRRRLASMDSGSVTGVVAGLDEIVQDSKALSEILEDLLIAADPREMAQKIHLDLAALADESVNSLQSNADGRAITLRRIGSTHPVLITGAPVSLQRLFTALITNALDHATSAVDVEVTVQEHEALIRVMDDGPGFASGMDTHAFERFATSRPTNNDEQRTRNYGLGLALVAEVATRHRGTVSVEDSRLGHGAVVTVRLPADS